jgi:hypothetical protein
MHGQLFIHETGLALLKYGRHFVRLIHGIQSFGWDGIIRVDGQPYQWLGASINVNFSTAVARGITPTRTTFTIQAGPMKFNATFFSPIEVHSLCDYYGVTLTVFAAEQLHSSINPILLSIC